jgi:hypothetical protein
MTPSDTGLDFRRQLLDVGDFSKYCGKLHVGWCCQNVSDICGSVFVEFDREVTEGVW